MAAIDYVNDTVRAAFLKVEARALAAEGGGITVPAAPSLTAAPGNGQNTLSWTDGSNGGASITSHKLYAGASSGTLALVGTITSASPYIDTGLTNGQARYYALTAINSKGESARSSTVSATPVGATIVAPARYAAFMDDFEGANALLSTRPNWSENGTTAGNLAKWSVADGVVYMNTNFSGATSAILGTPMTGDFILNLGYDFSGTYPTPVSGDNAVWSSALQQYRFWQQDESNYGWIAFDPATAGGRITIGAKIGGTEQSQSYWNGVTFNASKKGDLQVEMRSGIARLKVDGKWLVRGPRNAYPYDIADLTGVIPAGNRSGYTGINAQTRRWAQAGYFGVTPLDIACALSSDLSGTDVSLGTVGTGDIKGVFTGTPVRWIYKIRDYYTGALVQDWRDMTPNTAGGAAGLPTTAGVAALFASTISMPRGGPYSVEHGYIGSDGLLHTTQSMAMRCGPRGIYYGQSNSRGRGEQSYVPTVFSNLAAARADTNIGNIPDGQFASTTRPYAYPGSYGLASQLSTILGVPVGIDTRGIGSTSLVNLIPGGGPGWQTFLDGVAATRGVVEFVLWDQGENDADGAFYPTGYSDMFRTSLLPAMRDATGNPNLKVFICPVGRFASANAPNGYAAATVDGQRDTLHAQYRDIISKEPNVFWASSKTGCPHGGDSYHYAGVTYAKMGGRDAWSVAKNVFGANVHDGMGPKVLRIEWNATTIDVVYDLNGATGLTGPVTLATGTVPTPTVGNAKCGWQFSTDNFASALPMTGTPQIIGNKVRYTLASNPGTFPKARQDYGWSFDDTDTIQGTYSDFENITVWPQKAQLQTVAPQ